MALASQRAGVAEALRAELLASQPTLAAGFSKSVPDMVPKARRWEPEMREIAEFVGDLPSAAAYEAFAGLYRRLAASDAETRILKGFYDGGKPSL
jgi:hypothetical protein